MSQICLLFLATAALVSIRENAVWADNADGAILQGVLVDIDRVHPLESAMLIEDGDEVNEIGAALMKRNEGQEGNVKKSETALRFGKRARGASDAVLRFGRAGGARVVVTPMRVGRRSRQGQTVLRFGRARAADSALRFGRGKASDITLRFG